MAADTDTCRLRKQDFLKALLECKKHWVYTLQPVIVNERGGGGQLDGVWFEFVGCNICYLLQNKNKTLKKIIFLMHMNIFCIPMTF